MVICSLVAMLTPVSSFAEGLVPRQHTISGRQVYDSVAVVRFYFDCLVSVSDNSVAKVVIQT